MDHELNTLLRFVASHCLKSSQKFTYEGTTVKFRQSQRGKVHGNRQNHSHH
jgi:hypothetical protein